MSRGKRKSQAQSRLVARLIGMLLMAGIFVILGFIGLKFLSGMEGRDKPSAPTTTQTQQPPSQTKAPAAEAETPAKKPRYDFYRELSGRKAQVEAEIERKAETTAKVPEVSGSNYRIQVGAFREQEQANRMRARMILRDYPVTIIRNGKYYLVQVGPYKEKESAVQIQKKLKREGVDTLLKAYVND